MMKIINNIAREITSLFARERSGFDLVLNPKRKFRSELSKAEVTDPSHDNDQFLSSDGKVVTFAEFNQQMSQHFNPSDNLDSGKPHGDPKAQHNS